MLRGLIAAVGMSLAAVVPQASQAAFEKKVALVVGNAAYENAPALANPVTDAKAIAAAFERLGFETVTGFDLDRDGLQDTIREFARASRKADLTAFFYAGHGIAFEEQNYIIPVDARFADITALDFEAVKMDFVVKQMRYNDGVSLVFLDACRDNPLAATLTRSLGMSTRSAVSRGLADMDVKNAGKGLAIAFATSPGEVAYDGAEKHSPFTSALLNNLEVEGADITEVMSRVTGEVLRTTDERQRPWLNASLTGPVVLKPAPALTASIPAADAASGTTTETAAAESGPSEGAKQQIANLEADTKLFNHAYARKSIEQFEAYLATFPNGLYATIARQEIERLEAAEKEVEVASLTPADTVSDAPRSSQDKAAKAEITLEAAEAAEAEETDAALLEEGTRETEKALELDRDQRRAVQHRLNMVDADVGPADGLFGPMTRGGIRKWQAAEELPETGFLTRAQLTMLEEQTEDDFDAYVAEQQRIAAARAERIAAARAAERRAAAQAAAKRKAEAAKTRSYKKKSTATRKTARRSTKRVERRQVQRRQVERREAYRMGRHTYPRYRKNNNNGGNAAAFVGGVVGGLIIGGAFGN